MDLGDSRITHLPFADWLALEGQGRSAPYDRLGRRYDRNPPLFWEKTIEVEPALVADRSPESVVRLSGLIEGDLEVLVKALHWYTGTAPVHPLRSAIYFDTRGAENFAAVPGLREDVAQRGVPRRYGESEKEYATQNEDPTIRLCAGDTDALASMLDFCRRTRRIWARGQYEMASRSLELCATPGFGWQSRTLLLVGAYESLLLPDRLTGLQAAFQRRFSCMVASRYEDIGPYTAFFKTAYRLRSDLIHGRAPARPPSDPERYVAVLARAGVLALNRLICHRHAHAGTGQGPDGLWAALDAAHADPWSFRVLQGLLGHGSLASLRYQWETEALPC
ncbi:MAG TPA: hypothetical protein PKH69_02980 [Thiobacillaceae bacterium]|nr:hypothetical protein [Thiobacillaceae bacterium]HNU63051.1 hypothetical protein [Thiobacillaceae bacterium]